MNGFFHSFPLSKGGDKEGVLDFRFRGNDGLGTPFTLSLVEG